MKIKNNISGTVLVHVGGNSAFLSAGDEVPKGVSVRDDLVDGKAGSSEQVRKPRRRTKAAARSADS